MRMGWLVRPDFLVIASGNSSGTGQGLDNIRQSIPNAISCIMGQILKLSCSATPLD